MEIGIIILVQHGINDGVLQLLCRLITLKDLKNQRLQEVLLFSEVLIILNITDLEGIHGNRMVFTVADIDAVEIAADTLVRVTCVHHHHICILFQQLSDHRIRRERLSTSRRPQTKEVGVIRELHRTLLAGDVHSNGNTLSVGIEDLQG